MILLCMFTGTAMQPTPFLLFIHAQPRLAISHLFARFTNHFVICYWGLAQAKFRIVAIINSGVRIIFLSGVLLLFALTYVDSYVQLFSKACTLDGIRPRFVHLELLLLGLFCRPKMHTFVVCIWRHWFHHNCHRVLWVTMPLLWPRW